MADDAAASRSSSPDTASHSPRGTYCRITECHTTVSTPGSTATPARKSAAPVRSTRAGSVPASVRAPDRRAWRADWSGQTYERSASAPASVSGSIGVRSQPRRSVTRSDGWAAAACVSQAGGVPRQASVSRTGESGGPHAKPSDSYRKASARRLSPALAPSSSRRTGSGWWATASSRPARRAFDRPTSFVCGGRVIQSRIQGSSPPTVSRNASQQASASAGVQRPPADG
ncbi:hypothetical protein SRB5_29370 [Streptomyces sp. RB5]|uniref:Uncharacterized protein n=1 Tax=Streptomyces smaragdinus TaxID=2585196 RepID=A0A7K0CH65_9ACTN|nr:hypothetical protein [Streptomyces smaragdinus]